MSSISQWLRAFSDRLRTFDRQRVKPVSLWLLGAIVTALIAALVAREGFFEPGTPEFSGHLPEQAAELSDFLSGHEEKVVKLELWVNDWDEKRAHVNSFHGETFEKYGAGDERERQRTLAVFTIWEECPPDAGTPNISAGEKAGLCNGDRYTIPGQHDKIDYVSVSYHDRVLYVKGYFTPGPIGYPQPYVNEYAYVPRLLRPVAPENVKP